jgi:integrase
MGVTLAIDDFGTGYSSFTYLRQFRVSKLKIDRSFITNVAANPDDAAITAAIIGMAKNLNLKVIAEGVETEAQVSFLRAHQCDEIQGYYFSKPLAVDEVAHKLHQLWEFAMWRGDVPAERNPMTLVTVRGATKRTNAPRSLTFEEFQKFVSELPEPFRTMALLCLCLGLRISECLALKWADIDWLASKISVERAIVRQRVDDVKTAGSRKHLGIDGSLLEVLKTWKQTTQFSAPGDWVFASPTRLGRLPWSYPRVWGVFQKAAKVAKVGKKYGGESGIRTHVTLSSKHAFQACAFSHSAISPAQPGRKIRGEGPLCGPLARVAADWAPIHSMGIGRLVQIDRWKHFYSESRRGTDL